MNGVVFAVTRTADERFWEKVDKRPGDGCWVWTGSQHRGWRLPYGKFWMNGRMVPAHVWAWEQVHGPVPAGRQLDHVCDNPPCVRPGHLRVCVPGENTLRGRGGAAVNNRKTMCKRGHPLRGANLRINSNGARCCRTCDRDRMRRVRAARQAH